MHQIDDLGCLIGSDSDAACDLVEFGMVSLDESMRSALSPGLNHDREDMGRVRWIGIGCD